MLGLSAQNGQKTEADPGNPGSLSACHGKGPQERQPSPRQGDDIGSGPGLGHDLLLGAQRHLSDLLWPG